MVKKLNKKDVEIGTLIENFNDKVTFIAEQVVAIKETQYKHTSLLSSHGQKLDRIEMKLDRVETIIDDKADREEIKKLGHRVTALEAKI